MAAIARKKWLDLAEYPSLADWRDRVAERPSVRAEIELLATA